MPNHPVEGAEDAAAALTAAGIPNLFCHTGGNFWTTYVPLGHDDASETHVEDGKYLSILGDETAAADDRYVAYYRESVMADDEVLCSNVTLSTLVSLVGMVRQNHSVASNSRA